MELNELSLLYFLFTLLVGLGVGTFSGLFGVGGGVLMVPAFMYIPQFAKDTQHAMATSLAAMIPIAVAGAARYTLSGSGGVDYRTPAIICAISLVIGILLAKYLPDTGKVDYQLATAMAVGSVAGSFFIGVPIAEHIEAGKLARLFGLLLVVFGLRMIGAFPWLLQHLLSRGQPSSSA
jgi:uncharacterized membrane protein YfcA